MQIENSFELIMFFGNSQWAMVSKELMNFAVAQAPSLMKEVENVKAVSWQKTTLDREYGGPGKYTYTGCLILKNP